MRFSDLHHGVPEVLLPVPGEDGRASSRFEGLVLTSRYQPIFDFAGQHPVGYEGLLVATGPDGAPVPVADAFARARDDLGAVALDWLARALHLRNFGRLGEDAGRLFVNVSPAAAIHDLDAGEAFPRLLEDCGIDPCRVVIEILENEVPDEKRLAEAVALYRALGCGVALDDFAAGASAMERVWRLEPDIVKVDRMVVRAAGRDAHALRVLRSIVHMVHECGAKVVLEGIEVESEARVAVDTSAEYVQGYYFAHPSTGAVDDASVRGVFASLLPPSGSMAEQCMPQALLHRADAVQAASMALETGASFATAAELLVSFAGAVRGYLVTGDGRVLGSSVHQHALERSAVRGHAHAASRACARVRRLLHEALSHPGVVRLTLPYPAFNSALLCFTLAFAFSYGDEAVVLCADFPAGGGAD